MRSSDRMFNTGQRDLMRGFDSSRSEIDPKCKNYFISGGIRWRVHRIVFVQSFLSDCFSRCAGS